MVRHLFLVAILVAAACLAAPVFAAEGPSITIDFGKGAAKGQTAVVIQLLVLLTVLSLAPAFFIMVTSFTRIIIVLAFLRQALGTQQTPPNQILISLALFLTVFVMTPVWLANRVPGCAPAVAC